MLAEDVWGAVVVRFEVEVPEETEDAAEEEVAVDDEAHDAELGTMTPFDSQSWSAKVMVSTEQSQTPALTIPCSTHCFGPEVSKFAKCSRINN